jgi:cellulose 1,4-beta-cellobiosidase
MIDAGLDLPALFGIDPGLVDFYLVSIPQSGAFDVGAAEFPAGSPPPIPTAPSSLEKTAVTGSTIAMTWSDNASNESGYRVERSTDGLAFQHRATLTASATAYTDTGLAVGVTYWYRINAFNATGSSGYSNVVSATTSTVAVPAAPTGLVAAATSQKGRIQLNWNASAGATTYAVKRSTANGGPYTTVATGITATNYLNSGLRSKTTYYFVVTALNAAGESANSNQASARPK